MGIEWLSGKVNHLTYLDNWRHEMAPRPIILSDELQGIHRDARGGYTDENGQKRYGQAK